MRTNDILLDGFENICILQQYLYMSKDHFITVENSIGVKLEIRMEENLHYYCKNTNFPDAPETCYSDSMTNETMLAIIEQLKNTPAIEFPQSFNNRWDEIKTICSTNVVTNKVKWRK